MKQLGLIAAVAAVLFAPVIAQDEQRFGNMRFRLPLGWQAFEQGGTLFARPGNLLPGHELTIVLLPSQVLRIDFQTLFQSWVLSQTPRQLMPAFGRAEMRRGPNCDVLWQGVKLGPPAVRQLRVFMAFNPEGRFETIQAMASPEWLFQQYTQEIVQFLDSVSFGSAPARGDAAHSVEGASATPQAGPQSAPAAGERAFETGSRANPEISDLPPCPQAKTRPDGMKISVPPQLVGEWGTTAVPIQGGKRRSGFSLKITADGRFEYLGSMATSLGCAIKVTNHDTGTVTTAGPLIYMFPTNGIKTLQDSCNPQAGYEKPGCMAWEPRPWRIRTTPYGTELLLGPDSNPDVFRRR